MSSNTMTLMNTRVGYVSTFGEGKVNESGRRSWSLTAYIRKDDPQVDAIKAAINAAKEKDAAKIGKSGIKSPLLDGDAKNDDGSFRHKGDECRGHYLLRCVNYNRRPKVVDQTVQEILDPEQFYSGCYANLRISFYGYAGAANKGISPGLDAIQKVRDGERLSGTNVDAASVFTAVAEDFLA
jgi:hypothetical protein